MNDSPADLPDRKSLRLPKYDYRLPGAYFVTICTQDRRCILSDIRRGDPCGRPELRLTSYGAIAESTLSRLETEYGVSIDASVVMPNHVHFICRIAEDRATTRVAPTLGRIVGAYKSIVANDYRKAGLTGKLWQRGYYEHVIRGDADYRDIYLYIEGNPSKWAEDRYYQSLPEETDP